MISPWHRCSDIKKINLDEFQLISLDIFDTILHRTVKKPTDLFVLLASEAKTKGYLEDFVTDEDFARIRAEMEKKARTLASKTRQSSEVSFVEIWQQAPIFFSDKENIALLELELEFEVSFPNPYWIDFCLMLQREQIPFQLTSDTYFAKEFIQKLLKKAGLTVKDEQLMLSNEFDANKYTGKLFDKVLSKHSNIKAEHILHIGDDTVADAVQPQTRGIKSLHLRNIHIPAQIQQRWLLTKADSLPHPLNTLNRIGNSVCTQQFSDPKLTHFAISLYGPILASFCCWIVLDAHRRGIRRLCPIMREARVFKPLLEQAARAFGIEIQVIEFYTSRKASYLAKMHQLDLEAINQFRNRRSYTLADLQKELELPKLTQPLAEEAHLRLNDIKNQPALSAWLLSDDVQKAAAKTSANQRQLLQKYCQQCFGDEAVAMIDIGPGGNSLAWVAESSGPLKAQIKMNYLLYSIPELAKHLTAGHSYQSYFPTESENLEKLRVINRSPEPLEILLTGLDQTTTSYFEGKNAEAIPLTAAVFQQSLQQSRLLDFIAGTEIAMQHLLHICTFVQTKYLLNEQTRAAHLHELYALLELPTQEEASTLGSLIFDDNYGSDNYGAICSKQDAELLHKLGETRFSQLFRQQWGYNAMAVRWPQGTLTLKDPYFLSQQYLSSFNDTEFKLLCFTLICRAQAAGFKQIAVYGAGELGQQMVNTALQMGLDISLLVDSNQSMHGLTIANRPVVSLEQAFNANQHCYLVASSAFSVQICRLLREFYQEKPNVLTVFAINED